MKPATLLLLMLSYALSGAAQGLYEVPMEEKVSHSSLIFEGRVLASTSFWNDAHTMIFTRHQVQPSRIFKGNPAKQAIEVLTIGGVVGDHIITASEALTLEPGNTGIFFCFPNAEGMRSSRSGDLLFDVYSSAQGFLRYDMATQRASSPFEKYEDLTRTVYPRLEKLTGKKAIHLDTAFRVERLGAGTASKMMAPSITSFSPATVVAGKFSDPASNTLTITGSGFGLPGGSARVSFDGADDGSGGTPLNVSSTSDLIVSWTDLQIVVKVPGSAGTGTFTVYDAGGVGVNSPAPLQVSWAMLTAVVSGVSPSNLMYTLSNRNGAGGYSYYFSNSTGNSGVNFATSPEQAPFSRALSTWQQMAGLNFTYGGETSSQVIDLYDGVNIIMLDNTANGAGAVLPAGTLARCYSAGYLCNGNPWIVKSGFEIVIRNPGVSVGSTPFNNGPCPTTGTDVDMESVMLHELGHALNLAHINDDFKGSYLGYLDPQKVMNFSIIYSVDRRSPDWAALTGARYNVMPKGLTYCFANTEMIPLPTTVEAKDDCPLTFPTVATPPNTTISFDLDHAGSNRFVDPQYTAVLPSGMGTAITNNAWTVIRTGNSSGTLLLSVAGYGTVPASQSACTGAGVELAFYQVNSCPAGQSFPAPVLYRTFNSNGALGTISGLTPNTNYLVMADGLSNTRAVFNLTLAGTVLSAQFIEFNAAKTGKSVQLAWTTDGGGNSDFFDIETSKDGSAYYKIGSVGATTPTDG